MTCFFYHNIKKTSCCTDDATERRIHTHILPNLITKWASAETTSVALLAASRFILLFACLTVVFVVLTCLSLVSHEDDPELELEPDTA